MHVIEISGEREMHSSSGAIVSTGLDSTGWLYSLLTGASAIVQSLGSDSARELQAELAPAVAPRRTGKSPPVLPKKRLVAKSEFAWDASYLCFTVREPFPSRTTQTGIVFGRVTTHQPLTLTSQKPENGVIFSDGIEADFLEFRSGSRAVITPADRQGCLVV
jgi:hypothetical protein